MKLWLRILFVSICAIFLTSACTSESEKVSKIQGEEGGGQEAPGGVLPRNIDEYALGDNFAPGDKFQVDEQAAVFSFNEVEGVTYKSIPAPESDNNQPVYTICTINGRIFKIKKSTPMEFREADEIMSKYLTMYGKALDRENRPAAENEMHWIDFWEEGTFLRIEFLVNTLTVEISAYDLKP
jgi:hypothetical protein